MTNAHDYTSDCECRACLRVTVWNLRKELAALRAQEPVGIKSVILDNAPSMTTHIRKSGKRSFSGGEFAVYFECFKFESGEWSYYYTDNDNEYPQWRSLNGGHYRNPDEIIKTLIPLTAPAPAAVPDAVANLIPPGWGLYSVDASIQSSNPRLPMSVMLKRNVSGVQWWQQLTEIEKEEIPLYLSGQGMTLASAIQNAVSAMRAATQKGMK